MANEINDGMKQSDLGNKLVTSPKEVKTRMTKRAITNCIIAHAYTFIDSNAEAIVFSKVSFCENLAFIAAAKNKVIIFEDCNFHKDINLYGNVLSNIIFRNCRMRELLQHRDTHNCVTVVDCEPLSPVANYNSFINQLSLQEPSACN